MENDDAQREVRTYLEEMRMISAKCFGVEMDVVHIRGTILSPNSICRHGDP